MTRWGNAFAGLLLIATTGCEQRFPPGIMSVVSGDECRGLPPGISQLSFSDLAEIRGNRNVVKGPGANDTGDLLLLGFAAQEPGPPDTEWRVIDAEVVEQEAIFTFTWQPRKNEAARQRPASTCQVLGMDAGHFQRVLAFDDQGHPVGELNLL